MRATFENTIQHPDGKPFVLSTDLINFSTDPKQASEIVENKALPLNLILERNCRDLETRGNRLFTRQATKETLTKLYRSADLIDESLRLERCCQKYGALTCGSHIIKNYPTERCLLPLCPDCAVYRQRRAYRRLFPKFQAFAQANKQDRAVMITLTVTNTSDNLLKIHRNFKNSFRRLRQTINWKHHIRGGIASFELTVSKDTKWHYHCHILALRKSYERYEQEILSNDWKKASRGDGFIVDIRQIKDLNAGFAEVLKYSFKPLDLAKNRFSPERLKEFFELTRRSRLAESFGEFHGLNFDETETETEPELELGSPCPICQKPLAFIALTRDELISFYLGQKSDIIQRVEGFS